MSFWKLRTRRILDIIITHREAHLLETSHTARARLHIESLEARCLLSYTLTDLGTLPNGYDSSAYGISQDGQVIGYAVNYAGREHAFLWQDGTLTDLDTLGGRASFATGINDAGQVVGYSNWLGGAPNQFRAVLWNQGKITDLGTLPDGLTSSASAVNDAGQIAGTAALPPDQGQAVHACLWQDGTIIDLGTLGGTNSRGYGINNAGQVVGEADVGVGYGSHAFLWQDGSMTDLGTLEGNYSYGTAINDAGQVIGNSSSRGHEHGFLYSDGVLTDLGALDPAGDSYARGLNNLGQVVGYAVSPGSGVPHAFLWQDGVMTDLNSLAPPGWALWTALGINDLGQIVGYAANPSNKGRAFLLTPDDGSNQRPLGRLPIDSALAQSLPRSLFPPAVRTAAADPAPTGAPTPRMQVLLGRSLDEAWTLPQTAGSQGEAAPVCHSRQAWIRLPDVRIDSAHDLFAPGEP